LGLKLEAAQSGITLLSAKQDLVSDSAGHPIHS
jgi:hypothetical protein